MVNRKIHAPAKRRVTFEIRDLDSSQVRKMVMCGRTFDVVHQADSSIVAISPYKMLSDSEIKDVDTCLKNRYGDKNVKLVGTEHDSSDRSFVHGEDRYNPGMQELQTV